MKHSDDIVNLFQQFGASAEPYVELARQQEHKRSSERWPLISAVNAAGVVDVPSVNRVTVAAPQRRMADVFAAPVATPVATPPVAGMPVVPGAQPSLPTTTAPVSRAQVSIPLTSPTTQPEALVSPVAVPGDIAAQALVPARLPANSLQGRSPLAGLASQKMPLQSAEAPAPAINATSVDLSSIFARLERVDQTQAQSPVPANAVWQPRKGLT